MNKLKHFPFVEKDIAEIVKANGFDYPCLAGYNSFDQLKLKPILRNGEDDVWGQDRFDNAIPVPTYEQLFVWLREKYWINVIISYRDTNSFYWTIDTQLGEIVYTRISDGYEDALLASLDYITENILQQNEKLSNNQH